ncbi:unnamed protein product [Sympodiomycopsis kandeliae]
MKTGRKVDIVINNAFGRANSALIRAYVSTRSVTLPQLYFAIKYWFKNRGLNSPSGGGLERSDDDDDDNNNKKLRTLSSYAIALLVIRYLQAKEKLPGLQGTLREYLPNRQAYECFVEGYEAYPVSARLKNDPVALANKYSSRYFIHWDTSFVDPKGRDREHYRVQGYGKDRIILPVVSDDDLIRPDKTDVFRPEGKSDPLELGTLFTGFVEWLHPLVMKKLAFSIAIPQTYSLDEPRECPGCGEIYPIHEPWRDKDFVIVDPFLGRRNVAPGFSDERAMELLRKEIKRAHDMINNNYSAFDYFELAQPI